MDWCRLTRAMGEGGAKMHFLARRGKARWDCWRRYGIVGEDDDPI